MPLFSRRMLLQGAGSLAGASALIGCDRVGRLSSFRQALQVGEDANLYVQRLLLTPGQLAPEYTEADMSPWFKPNGSSNPTSKTYRAMARRSFLDFRLAVDGLVEKPAKFSLADLRKLPARTQITRHDCVEGWTCIGKWTGVPLSELLNSVGLKPEARFIIFHCADVMEGPGSEGSDSAGTEGNDDSNGTKTNMTQQAGGGGSRQVGSSRGADGGSRYVDSSAGTDSDAKAVYFYGSIDLTDAYHPQTILAYDMNSGPLPVAHGAPLRLRVERQLGYKMSKYIMRIEVVDDYSNIGDGKGGYWEDRGYDWYAGI